MKILVVSHMYPSSFNHMSGIFVHKQVKALIKKGCEVKVVSPVPYSPFPLSKLKKKWEAYSNIPYSTIYDGVEVFYPRYVEFPNALFFAFTGFSVYMGIRKLIDNIYKDYGFDVILSHVALPDGFAAGLVNKKYKLPHVLTVHGQDFQVTINRNETCRKNVFRAIDEVDRLVVVSSKLKRIVKNEKNNGKIVVINNGVDPMDCRAPGEDINCEVPGRIILSISNLKRTKGIDLNIKAMAGLVKKHPDIKYYIIGDGPEKEELIKLVKDLKLFDCVKFLGKLPHSAAMNYISCCDIFCLPSWQEGFGVVYLEAMANGKPVIGVRGEGIEDVIVDGENGLLVNPKSIEDIERAVDYLLSNHEKAQEIGQEARKCVLNKLTWDDNARKTIELCKGILKEHVSI